MQHLPGFAPLARHYDGFILDLWGVIHDGVTAYPGAVDCLARLAAAGKRVVLLSNAPRRAAPSRVAMRAMGIPDAYTANLFTSGEAVHLALRDRTDPWFAALGRRVFHLGPERDRNVIADLDLDLVPAPAAASFVLNTGPDDERDPSSLAPFEPILRDCADARLPMICANPDLEVIRGGVRVICAGLLAQRYADLGGEVRSLGKPDPAIYAPVLAMLATSPARTLAVGDSLRTDIAGAARAGLDAAWVLGGIHADALAGDPARVEAAARAAGLAPVAALPRFAW
jgi:HAD superfamily hydrolase (TIGR01459 family)